MIGLGGIAQKAYLPILASLEDVELAVVMSRRAEVTEHVRAQYRLPAGVTDRAAFLRQNPDAAVVLTPSATHFDIVKSLLEGGSGRIGGKTSDDVQP